MEFGSNLTKMREGRGWTRAKLAEKTGVDEGTVAAWEEGREFPAQEQLLSLAMALKVKVGRLIEADAEVMAKVIDGTDQMETVVMGIVSVVTLVCALALVAISNTAPESVELASRVTEGVIFVAFLAMLYLRRSPAALRAKTFADALQAAEGSQTKFVLRRRAGRNPRNVALQFVLGAVIAFTLIVLLSVIIPESDLPWVML